MSNLHMEALGAVELIEVIDQALASLNARFADRGEVRDSGMFPGEAPATIVGEVTAACDAWDVFADRFRDALSGPAVDEPATSPDISISRDALIEALRDGHRNDSAADMVEFVSDLVGWSAEDDEELIADRAEAAGDDYVPCVTQLLEATVGGFKVATGDTVRFKRPNLAADQEFTVTDIGRDSDGDVWVQVNDGRPPFFDWADILVIA